LLGVYNETSLRRSAEWYISEKFDGYRMTYVNGVFYTRQGNVINVPSGLREEVRLLVKASGKRDLPLDGELWSGYNTCNEITASISAGDPRLRFMVFDSPSTRPYSERLGLLTSVFSQVSTERVVLIPKILMKGQDLTLIDSIYQEVLRKGGEGVVIKPSTMDYLYETRYELFMKKKPFELEEVIVLEYAVTEAAEQKQGDQYVSSLVCDASSFEGCDGRTFKVTCKSYNPPPIGSIVTIRYSQHTASGLPKFPVLVNIGGVDESVTMRERLKKPGKRPAEKPLKPTDIVKTSKEWDKLGGYPLENGERVSVQGGSLYVVARALKGNSVYCSCPSWRFQHIPGVARTCKHVRSVIGIEADKTRLEAVTGK
jgi:DNA ligase-1